MTIQQRLQELKELCEKATPGPWHRAGGKNNDHENDILDQHNEEVVSGVWDYGDAWAQVDQEDADFIAASRTALPRLIAAIEQVEKLGWICERHPGGTLGNDCGDCGRGAGRKDAQLAIESALLEKL